MKDIIEKMNEAAALHAKFLGGADNKEMCRLALETLSDRQKFDQFYNTLMAFDYVCYCYKKSASGGDDIKPQVQEFQAVELAILLLLVQPQVIKTMELAIEIMSARKDN